MRQAVLRNFSLNQQTRAISLAKGWLLSQDRWMMTQAQKGCEGKRLTCIGGGALGSFRNRARLHHRGRLQHEDDDVSQGKDDLHGRAQGSAL